MACLLYWVVYPWSVMGKTEWRERGGENATLASCQAQTHNVMRTRYWL